MLREKSKLKPDVTKLIEEERGLSGLNKIVQDGISVVQKFLIETKAKNETLKELELLRKEKIEQIEKIYDKTNSYLVMKRLIDIASEINDKYHIAVEEVENVYGSNMELSKKLEAFEEVKSITNSYYKIILEETEKYKITTS